MGLSDTVWTWVKKIQWMYTSRACQQHEPGNYHQPGLNGADEEVVPRTRVG